MVTSMEQCPHCFYNKDKNHLDKILLTDESYPNIYGRICSNCGKYIKPITKPKFLEENEAKIKIIQEEVRERLRKSIKNKMERT